MKLTPDSIAAIVAAKADQIFWDDDMPGFGVRVRGDTKRYVVQYRVGTQQRRETIGDLRKVKIADARKAAQRLFAKVELGVDPAAERAKARVAATAATLTLSSVAASYLAAKVGGLRASTYRASETYLTKHWEPLGKRPIGDITRSDVAARLQELIEVNGRSAAHGARSKLSALFAWAQREGFCDHNPVMLTNNPREGSQPRDRVLSDSELAAVWRASQQGDDGGDSNCADFNRIIRLLLLTGCRREEIGGLRWDEIDGNIMTIPSARTKNGRAHRLTLPALALQTLPPRRDGRAFVFGQRGGAFCAWSYEGKALLVRIAVDLPRWTLHDLRRTFRTGLSRLGVASDIAELCINHQKGGIEAVYNHYRYQKEIAAALALWADHVAAVVEDRASNVVPMRA